MNILLEKSSAIIRYDAHYHLISIHFIRKITFQEYKELLNQVLEFIKQKGSPQLLIDQRFSIEINIEERAWFITKWIPKLQEIAESTFKLGFIAPKDRFDKIGAEYVFQTLSAQSIFPVGSFENTDEAFTWFEDKVNE